MKIVVVGGTGLIGSTLVEALRDRNHDVMAASRATGVDTITGEGLADALSGAQHVLEMFRRTFSNSVTRTCLDRLSNRLTKIIAEAKKLSTV